ncbi:MAG TPA: PorP/SprF family type IX secretion system membrane protein, partial [Saprospiraceae bacterium]|nr:PorP/SprF family type IX secretion system membrane protein [Saprospiraceae bacterium]
QINSGIGFQLQADDAGGGLLKTIKAAGTYGYQARISEKNYLRGGIELGWVQTNYDWDRLVFGDQLDPEFGPISPGGTPYPTGEIRPDKTQVSYLDIGTGLLYYNPLFNIGVSAKHINTPQNDILKINPTSYTGIPVRWVVHGSMQLDLDRRRSRTALLSPAFLLARQSGFFQLNLGAQMQFSTVFAGLWYRQARQNPDALIGVFGFKKGLWKMAYSFDYTLSSLGISQGGSHEISMGIYLDEIYREKPDINDCFEAFR